MNTEENTPVLEFIAGTIVVGGVAKKIYEKTPLWLNEIDSFFVSIWPTVLAVLVTISALILLVAIGKIAIQQWKNHRKYVDGLNDKISELWATIRAKDSEIRKLNQKVTWQEGRISRLQNGLSRYHRLLVRKIAQHEMKPKEAQKKVKSTLASVLKDFGTTSSKGGLS
jgi:peptidoglycan hydrolase CwlO-like protein